MNDNGIGIRIEKGNPDDVEIAALVTALLLATAEPAEPSVRPAPALWLRPRRRAVFVTANSWCRAA
ncbi:acyl-CoA carboxylase epsilon subunit [Nocardia mexicana]|uniref:Acyl-CoA carboxylase epsilon subunit-like protein n=1 Tax=Nocardia mexicana TaxID=279262 RepID=A0A370H5Z4_9NOCA|nr:acyl-CoA carboxylase epsilon subunit [Nocardia mexicana]RDI51634.1 acyl-CoA carboxylase epsilon subunit-like protein [Nocardia mexicana]